MKEISRYGAHAVVIRNSSILLTQKKSGPFKGLWGLPGGKIEFGESPEETLKRELIEETALMGAGFSLLRVISHFGEYCDKAEPYKFHHIGIIYKVATTTLIPHLIPEEEVRWILLKDIKQEELTPFAKQIITDLNLGE